MYLTDNTMTVVRFDRTTQSYNCTVISGVSWAMQKKRYDNSVVAAVIVRVPEDVMPDGLQIETGDYICRGIADNISRREDLEQYERCCVTEVHDNRRGTYLRHWAVIGK